jgi:hypothetical protein
VPAGGRKFDELPEDETPLEIAVLELEEAANDALDPSAVGGGGDEARLDPLVLPRLYEVLDDERRAAESVEEQVDLIHHELPLDRDPDRARRVAFEGGVPAGEVVRMDVGRRGR